MDTLESSYIAIIILIILGLLAIYIFFFNIAKTLEAIDISSRTMHPAEFG